MNIFLTGAAGMLGSHLVHYLEGEYSLTLMTRGRIPSQEGGAKWISADLTCPDSLRVLLGASDCVIHLAAITHSNNRKKYYQVNEEGTLNLVRVCEEGDIRHFIFVSTRAIDPSGGAYSRSKYAAEKIVENSRLNWTIIRPAEIYGGNNAEMITKLIKVIKRFNLVMLPGDGMQRVAPVFIDDVAQFISRIILDETAFGKTYTLAGPKEYSLCEFADLAATYLGAKHNPVKLKVPLMVIRILLELNRRLRILSAMSYDQLDRLIIGKSSDSSLAALDFDFRPLDLKAGIRKIIDNKSL